MKKSSKIIILGAGLTGLSTAYHLHQILNFPIQLEYEIFEAEPIAGGLGSSVIQDGFTFDYTGHILHLRKDYVKKLIRKLLGRNYKSHKRNSWIYSKTIYTRYPFQANTYGLPLDVVKDCVLGFVKAKCLSKSYCNSSVIKHQSFYDRIIATFGQGIARHFMIPYNEKVWTVHPNSLTCDWMHSFVPQPSLEEVIDGAFTDQKRSFGYNVSFLYPKRGGIQTLPNAFLPYVKNLKVNSEITKVDVINKIVEINNIYWHKFDHLVSTLPLKKLIKLVDKVPRAIKNAAEQLKCNSVLNINFGISRAGISDKHWIYFPEKEFIFYRVGFPMNFSPSVVPKGTSSIYTEIAYRRDRRYVISGTKYRLPRDKAKIIQRVKKDLIKAGILRSNDKILTVNVLDIENAYVIYDKNRRKSLEIINKFLLKNNIYSIGRYGGWKYLTMEDAILEGKQVAERFKELG